jgi:ABC-2 type transport system permease protein
MNHMWNLVKKELRELLTPSSLISIIVVVVILMSLGSFMGSEIESQTSTQPIGYYDPSGAADGYAQYSIDKLAENYDKSGLESSKYIINLAEYMEAGGDIGEQLYNAMEKAEVSSALVFDSDFNSNIKALKQGTIHVYWVQTSTSVFSSLNTLIASQVIGYLNSYIGDRLASELSLDKSQMDLVKSPSVYTTSTYLNGTLHEGVTPDQIYSAMSSQTMFIPIIIMLIIVMIGSIVISSIGNEKENKTMETLLTLPINRTTIVTGKLVGASIAGLIMGALYIVGMYFYINGMTYAGTSSGVSLDSLGLALGVTDWILVIVMMFLAIICALGMCMILGAFAKNYKAAQTLVMPISVLALIPMFVTMFTSYYELPTAIQVILFIIPFTHPMMAMQNLMFGQTAIVLGGVGYLAVFAVLMIYITVRLYKSDILLTGIILSDKAKKLIAGKKSKE